MNFWLNITFAQKRGKKLPVRLSEARAILFGNEKFPKVLYPNQRLGNTLCTFHGKSNKTTAHSPTLKVGFTAEAILQGVMLAQYQQNIIVSFSLKNVIIFLSLVQCEISVTFFIFAKRCFPLSAQDYRLLQKVA